MPVSEARLAANRANGAKSQGPITPEGKAASRRNGLKHGLTGEGIVIPEVDQGEVDRRIEAFIAEMQPKSEAGFILVGQMAMLSVREERSSRHEFAAIACRVRHAPDDFDEERIEQAEALFKSLSENPRGTLRKLRKSPEGIDSLIDAWRDLRADLSIKPKPLWTREHLDRAAQLTGLKSQHAESSRLGDLSLAFWGDFTALGAGEGDGLDESFRREWARSMLFELIDGEIAALEAHCETLDCEMIELDRAEAGERALFDTSKAATLARRYEAEARRGFFKALKEFRLVEAEFARQIEAATAAPKAPQPAPAAPRMGSSWENTPPPPREPARPVPATPKPAFSTAVDRNGQPLQMIPTSKPRL